MQKIFDRTRFKLHRDRVAKSIHNHDFLIRLSIEDILGRLTSLTPSTDSILEISARTGLLTSKLIANYPDSYITVTDISESMLELNPAKTKILVDEELIELPTKEFDVILSVLNMHNINDIMQFLCKVAKLLKPNGLFIASLFGAGSLAGLRNFLLQTEIATYSGHSPHISPFATASDIYRLLQLSGFQFIITDTQKIEIEYDSPLACMHELRNMGESNILVHSTRPLTKSIFQNARAQEFVDCAEIITLTARLK